MKAKLRSPIRKGDPHGSVKRAAHCTVPAVPFMPSAVWLSGEMTLLPYNTLPLSVSVCDFVITLSTDRYLVIDIISISSQRMLCRTV